MIQIRLVKLNDLNNFKKCITKAKLKYMDTNKTKILQILTLMHPTLLQKLRYTYYIIEVINKHQGSIFVRQISKLSGASLECCKNKIDKSFTFGSM